MTMLGMLMGNRCYTCGMDDCIEHQGYCPPSKGAPRGYGKVNRKVNGKKITLAHRYAWTLAHGDIPDGMTVDHMCGNTRCVNVEHLQLLTQAENIRKRRMPQKEKTHCIRGHEFTEENTYRWAKRPNDRYCRACHRERARARKGGQ